MASLISQSHTETSVDGYDDSMEISSDHGRQCEDDIDIDIDVPTEDVQFTKDDDMVDENASILQDDDMFDEDRPADVVVEEQMQDHLQDYDEDLADDNTDHNARVEESLIFEGMENETLQQADSGYLNSEVLAENDTAVDVASENHSHSSRGDQLQSEEDFEHTVFDEGNLGEELDEPHVASHPSPDKVSSDKQLANVGVYSKDTDIREVYSVSEDQVTELESPSGSHSQRNDEIWQLKSHDAPDEINKIRDSATQRTQRDSPVASVKDDGDTPGFSRDSVSAIPLDTAEVAAEDQLFKEQNEDPHLVESHELHLHPVVVHWDDEDIPLFSSGDASEFFLSDSSVITSPLVNLFSAFKEVLQEESAEQFSLSVQFPEMGLIIQEHETEALCTTFADLVSLHLQLKLNDGDDDPGPLYVNLTSRQTAEARLTFLLDNAREGLGMTEVGIADPSIGDVDTEDQPHEHAAEGQLADAVPQEGQFSTGYQSSDVERLVHQQSTGLSERQEFSSLSNQVPEQEYGVSHDISSVEEPNVLYSMPMEKASPGDDKLAGDTFGPDDLFEEDDAEDGLFENNDLDESSRKRVDATSEEFITQREASDHSSISPTTQRDMEPIERVKYVENAAVSANEQAEGQLISLSSAEDEIRQSTEFGREADGEDHNAQNKALQASTLDNQHANVNATSGIESDLRDLEDTSIGEQVETTGAKAVGSEEDVTKSGYINHSSQDRSLPLEEDMPPQDSLQFTLHTNNATEDWNSESKNDTGKTSLAGDLEWADLSATSEAATNDSPRTIPEHEEFSDAVAPAIEVNTNVSDSSTSARKRSLRESEGSEDQLEETNEFKRPRAH